ncbi:hypothetical protein IV203_010259 [Nitzschia inconspicua]|uniref:Uncharacterized protein n=1 Tax=Nitzschia inconspicua TaxID=303405 RepID=A0A9K3KVR6_9STRA|nr:hypothetical protein IV203_010259 [Nitzschia inconspicua]
MQLQGAEMNQFLRLCEGQHVNRPDTDSDNDSGWNDMPGLISPQDDDDDEDDDSLNDLPDLLPSDESASDEEEEVKNTGTNSSHQTSYPESINCTVPTIINMPDDATDAAISPPQCYPRQNGPLECLAT